MLLTTCICDFTYTKTDLTHIEQYFCGQYTFNLSHFLWRQSIFRKFQTNIILFQINLDNIICLARLFDWKFQHILTFSSIHFWKSRNIILVSWVTFKIWSKILVKNSQTFNTYQANWKISLNLNTMYVLQFSEFKISTSFLM